MLIKQETFLDILGIENTQFVVPVYQRVYSWSARHCHALWDDIMRAGASGKSHFTGVLLFAQDPDMWNDYGRIRVIDGQQRTTTVTLILIALQRRLAAGSLAIEGIDADLIARTYLFAGSDKGAPCKLMLSHLDRPTIAALIDGADLPAEHSERLAENLALFDEKMDEPGFDAEALWRGLGAMQVITALLEDGDEPQLVFESLNSKGVPLTAGDLVRNAMITGTTNEDRMALYNTYWLPLEQALAEIDGADMDALIRGWLACKFQDERVRSEADVYALLKDYMRESGESLEELLDDLRRFGARYTGEGEFRTKANRRAKEWLEDRPRLGGMKLFGN